MNGTRPVAQTGEQGFSYVMVMFTVALLGLTLTAAAQQWKSLVQRELEADLLSKGLEIQNAIALYSATMKAGRTIPGEIYPAALADLTRKPKPALRKVYLDPMGHGEWELVRHPNGGIMGVRSRSYDKPMKKREFPPDLRHFENLPTYHDWVFQYPNVTTASAGVLPGAPPGMPAVPNQPTPSPAIPEEPLPVPAAPSQPVESMP